MEVSFIHISDIHFYPGGEEKKPAFIPFLRDLEAEVELRKGKPVYLVVSGDIAQAGGKLEHYSEFLDKTSKLLDTIGLVKSRRICVPGNHDVSSERVQQSIVDHDAIVGRCLEESAFNDYSIKPASVFSEKFTNYLSFQHEFAGYGIDYEQLSGKGHILEEGIGVFCTNTAFFSSGAAKIGDQKISDKGKLPIPTREICKWLDNVESKVKIYVAHHPAEWLSPWAQSELRNLSRRFDLVLFGHLHKQDVHHSIEYEGNTVNMCAPALLTDKRAPMGYSVVTVDDQQGPIEIKYRQWTGRSKFVLGTLMSETDDGVVNLAGNRRNTARETVDNPVLSGFMAGLERSLKAYGKDLRDFIEPRIKKVAETERAGETFPCISIREIVSNEKSVFIKAPPQYGLTCLSWALCAEAMKCDSSRAWVRLDMSITKPHGVRDELDFQIRTIGAPKESIKCIVVDSWHSDLNNARKCLDAIIRDFPHARMIVLETQDRPSLNENFESISGRIFECYYLWALPRSGLRRFVCGYYSESPEVDKDRALARAVADLEALNLPWTALNCLTLLMVSEVDYDDSPINRAEVIKRILFLIFSSEADFTYKSRADLKDCEHLLGNFAEQIIISGEASFSKADFLRTGRDFCERSLVDIDVGKVLKLLIYNGVIVETDHNLRFRFSYWVYYFAANRMHHDSKFAQFIMSNMQYTRFPEVMEFYTGIDRRRADAVATLNSDLTELCDQVEKKCGLSTPDVLFCNARWDPSDGELKKLRAELDEQVSGSTLPDEIKDQFADRSYDPSRPYDQQIKSLMDVYSYQKLSAGVRAACRTLRNSDFVDPEMKKSLLKCILRCLEQIETVLVLIAPALASHGEASFDGTNFTLDQSLRDAEVNPASVGKVWSVVPFNVLSWYRSDLASAKLGPLLYSVLKEDGQSLRRHNIAIAIASMRPNGWRTAIEDYVACVDRRSFFLWDIYTFLLHEYRTAYIPTNTRTDVLHLMKMSVAKHETGAKRPNTKLLKKVSISNLEEPNDSLE